MRLFVRNSRISPAWLLRSIESLVERPHLFLVCYFMLSAFWGLLECGINCYIKLAVSASGAVALFCSIICLELLSFCIQFQSAMYPWVEALIGSGIGIGIGSPTAKLIVLMMSNTRYLRVRLRLMISNVRPLNPITGMNECFFNAVNQRICTYKTYFYTYVCKRVRKY